MSRILGNAGLNTVYNTPTHKDITGKEKYVTFTDFDHEIIPENKPIQRKGHYGKIIVMSGGPRQAVIDTNPLSQKFRYHVIGSGK